MRPAAAARPPRRIGTVHWLGIATLIRRELWRTLKFWVATVAAAGFNAVLYLVILVLALGPELGTPEGAALLAFVLPGLVLLPALLRAAETPAFSLVFDKLEGVVSDVLMPPLAPSEMAAAYALAGTAAGLLAGLPVLAVAMLAFGMPAASPPVMAVFAVGGALMLALFGVAAGLWAAKWDHVTAVFGFVLTPLVFLSGLFAPVDRLPDPLPLLFRLNPVFYVIDGFRAGATGAASAPLPLGLAVVGLTDLALWLLCDRLIRSGWRLKA